LIARGLFCKGKIRGRHQAHGGHTFHKCAAFHVWLSSQGGEVNWMEKTMRAMPAAQESQVALRRQKLDLKGYTALTVFRCPKAVNNLFKL
jgi:hypothetical protein